MMFRYVILGFMMCVQSVYASEALKEESPFTVNVYLNTHMPDPESLNLLKSVITNFHVSVHPNGVGDMNREAYMDFSNRKFDRHGEDLMKGLCQLLIVRKGHEIKGGGFIYLAPESAMLLKCGGIASDEDRPLSFKAMFDHLSSKDNFPDKESLTVFMRRGDATRKALEEYGFKISGQSHSDYSPDFHQAYERRFYPPLSHDVFRKQIQ